MRRAKSWTRFARTSAGSMPFTSNRRANRFGAMGKACAESVVRGACGRAGVPTKSSVCISRATPSSWPARGRCHEARPAGAAARACGEHAVIAAIPEEWPPFDLSEAPLANGVVLTVTGELDLAGAVPRWVFALILGFVGTKMLLEAVHVEIPIVVSLLVIIGVLAATVVLSLVFPEAHEEHDDHDDHAQTGDVRPSQ